MKTYLLTEVERGGGVESRLTSLLKLRGVVVLAPVLHGDLPPY